MIPLEQAQEYILQQCVIGSPERRSSRSSLGLVLAEEVLTAEDVPPFDNTAMDGFAIPTRQPGLAEELHAAMREEEEQE